MNIINTQSEALHSVCSFTLTIVPIALAIMLFFCLIRAIRGPRIADRIVAINMMGTITMVIIATLAVRMNEGYLVDICLIYAMISFLAVTLLTKVYMGVYAERNAERSAAKEAKRQNRHNTANPDIQHSDKN